MAKKTKKRTRTVVTALGGLLLVAVLVLAFWPSPILVDLGTVERGPMRVTIDEEGRTDLRERYLVSAPVAGRLLRVELEPGDPVEAGETVVARMRPTPPPPLDSRARAEAEAAVAAAEAAVGAARTRLRKAEADAAFARTEAARARQQFAIEAISQAALEAAEHTLSAAQSTAEEAAAELARREADRTGAQARLLSDRDVLRNGATDLPQGPELILLRAPVTGEVLTRHEESETTLAAGAPIIEIGNLAEDLEVVVELLSTDAVRVAIDDPVLIEGWGGDAVLAGTVQRIDPSGFSKYSALGVEEQRVNATIRFTTPPEKRTGLGNAFRVEVRIVVWEDDDALIVPASALFRHGEGQWAVFVADGGEAELREVEIARNNGTQASVTSGLKAGEAVVLYPATELNDGAEVKAR